MEKGIVKLMEGPFVDQYMQWEDFNSWSFMVIVNVEYERLK